MGLFAEWQPEYAAHDVVTFPIGGNKRPAVKQWQKAGLNASAQWAFKFGEADAFAFLAGQRNRITVLDVDTKDERVLSDAISRHGEPAIIVRSGSGNFQGWYRHNGERRRIRPDPSRPIDILGYGVVVAPPSRGSRSPYQFIKGSLDDLDRMTPMRSVDDLVRAETVARAIPATGERIGQGRRRDALLDHLRRHANHCDTLDDLIDIAFGFANQCLDRNEGHPFTDAEVIAQARSCWEWTQAGNNFVGRGRHLVKSHENVDKVMALGADAYFLHDMLRVKNWTEASFQISNPMAEEMPGGVWTRKRFAAARQSLLDAEIVKEVQKASSYHGPALYRWN